MIVDEDKKSGKQQRRYLVYDMIMLEGEVLIRRPFKVMQLAEQANVLLWWAFCSSWSWPASAGGARRPSPKLLPRQSIRHC